MMLLCAFDLPRETKEERKAANKYRKRLVELGFAMKQFSLYEREVRHIDVKNRLIDTIPCSRQRKNKPKFEQCEKEENRLTGIKTLQVIKLLNF